MLGDDLLTKGLVRSLDIAALRQQLTAQNIANLNTPGYKRSYVAFSETLDKARETLPLKKTASRHLPGINQDGELRVKVEKSTAQRPDANNVELDQEMMNMVSNQLRYNVLVQKISDRYADWRYVINEGRR